MTRLSPPHPTDVTIDVAHAAGWCVTCPPRLRMRHGMSGASGIAAGLVLGATSMGGVYEAVRNPSWGVRLFLLGWMLPLAVIAVLLIWLGGRTLRRVWQVDVLESDGETVRHRRVGWWGGSTLFEVPAALLDPLGPPTAEDVPELADAAARDAWRGPLILSYRQRPGGNRRDYLSLPSTTWDEQQWLAATLNPTISQTRPTRTSG